MENVIKFDLNEMGSSDIQSMHKVIEAYIQIEGINNMYLDILETGFNTSSGYVYIALENGISIASCFSQEVTFLVTDFETGEEFFLDTYEQAEEKQNNLSTV